MNVQVLCSGYAFSRNPIVISEKYQSETFDRNGGYITVTVGGTNVYEGRFTPPLKMDVSEIVDAWLTPFGDADSKKREPLMEICDSGELWEYNVVCSATYGGLDSETSFMVFPGGISKQNYRQVTKQGTDIFKERFLNYKSNFFLTTRTASWRVVMKETELYPLYFFIRQQGLEIKITEPLTGTTIAFDRLGQGMLALDFHELRRKFMVENAVLPNIFDVYVAGVFSCRIVIERSDTSKERYRLKFRNSLGVFEIIELSGELSITPDYGDNEDAAFKRYDAVTCDFYTDRERVSRSQSITVETGVKRPDEVRFLMDMLGSEEVYLLDLSGLPIKVIPSVEEFNYRPRPDTPQKFTIKLQMTDDETNIMQDIIKGSEGHRPRLFSHLFSNRFD